MAAADPLQEAQARKETGVEGDARFTADTFGKLTACMLTAAARGAFDSRADGYCRRLYLPVVSRGYASAVR